MPDKILVVDDEPHLKVIIRQTFRRSIRSGERLFFFAANGRQALEILEQQEDIDVVLSDIRMPEMNGLTLLKHLEEHHPLVRCVMLTAYGDMKHIRAAMNHGAFDFLTKPIDLSDLEVTLEKTLSQVRKFKALHRERRGRDLVQQLQQLSETLSMDMGPLLQRCLDNMVEVIHFDAGLGYQRTNELEFVTAWGAEMDVEMEPSQLEAWEDTARNHGYVVFNELQREPNRSLIGLPLVCPREQQCFLLIGREKPFSDAEVEVASSLAQSISLVSRAARLFETVDRLTTQDSLTGLANEQGFVMHLDKELRRVARYDIKLSMMLLRFENLEHLNKDGILALMRQASRMVQASCRQTDYAARPGDCELGMILVHTDKDQALAMAERILQAIPLTENGCPLRISVTEPKGSGVTALASARKLFEQTQGVAESVILVETEAS